MTLEEREKIQKDLLQIRQELDLLYASAFTFFVQSVHNLSLMLQPLIKQQQALAYKMEQIEAELRSTLNG